MARRLGAEPRVGGDEAIGFQGEALVQCLRVVWGRAACCKGRYCLLCCVLQMAVALYFIDKLALRAGHEKDEDEADTVGCCTLKVGTYSGLLHTKGRSYIQPYSGLVHTQGRYIHMP